jgi:ferredoxin/flavodoxin---NADP+ reductase
MTGLIEAKITFRRDWAPGLATLGLSAALDTFRPGQFVNLGLEVAGELVRRAYSLASAPGADPEVFLNEVEGGALTPSLFRLQQGDRVLMEQKPQGFFTLDWVPPADERWLCATGTGLAPFVSMLRSGEPLQKFLRVVLVHGVRQSDQLAYAGELESLCAASRGRFAHIGVVSRQPDAAGVLHGRITSVLESGALEQTAGLQLSPAHSHVMLCGNPTMIDEMSAQLAARGLRRHRQRKPGHVTSERFWE